MAIERAIELAANDISDAIDCGRSNRRRAAMRAFLKMALWAAASSAESIPTSAWVNLKADDSWLKTAKEKERFQLPEMSDKQFREVCNKILGIGNEQLETMIPPQVKMNPSLGQELNAIIGSAPAPEVHREEAAPLPPAPERKTPKEVPMPAPGEPPAKEPPMELSGKVSEPKEDNPFEGEQNKPASRVIQK